MVPVHAYVIRSSCVHMSSIQCVDLCIYVTYVHV